MKIELQKKKQQNYEELMEKQKLIVKKLSEKGLSAEEKKKLMKVRK